MLKRHIEVSEGIEQALTKALKARNKLIHRYLIENVERLAEPRAHNEIVKEIRSLRSEVRKAHQMLDPFIKSLAEILCNISIDNIANEAKGKFMQTTNANLDL